MVLNKDMTSTDQERSLVLERHFSPILVMQKQTKKKKKKKKNNNNFTIQNTWNSYEVVESSMQYCDEWRVVAILPAGCCAMSKQATTKKTSRLVTVFIVVQMVVFRRLCCTFAVVINNRPYVYIYIYIYIYIYGPRYEENIRWRIFFLVY